MKMKKVILGIFLLAIMLLIVSCCYASFAYDVEEISIYSPILSIEVEPRRISIPLIVSNLMRERKEISFKVACPAGWSYSILFKEYNVSKISLRENESMNLTLVFEPYEVAEKQYIFSVSAYRDNQLVSNILNINVNIIKPTAVIKIEPVSNVVSGSPGSTFSFKLNIKNNSYRDLSLKLDAEIPEGWTKLGFKPSPYEKTVISDIMVKAQSTYWLLTLDVFCPEGTEPRKYPVNIVLLNPAEGIYEKVELLADVAGKPDISLKTEGDLLSYSVEAGGEIIIPLIIENTGTTHLDSINLYSYSPSGWKVSIKPANIPGLPKGHSDTAELHIRSPPGALAGDYLVEVRAYGGGASSEITLRITVTKTTYWGIIGIVVIVAALLGLVLVFWRFGRL